MTNETWGEVQDALRKSVGEDNYRTWIEPLSFASEENGVVHLNAPTSFIGSWVSRNYSHIIVDNLAQTGAQVARLQFDVKPSGLETTPQAECQSAQPVQANAAMALAAPAVVTTGSAAPQPAETTSAKNSASAAKLDAGNLDPRCTFDTFVVGKPNELAHAAARRVAEGGPTTFNPLFLYGGVGLGKTHLMHAIAWHVKQQAPHLQVLYLSAEQFMYRFVQALRERQMMDFKEIFRTTDLLMVDDVQFIAGKDSTQEEFFHTFNALVDQNKQIIISGDRSPS
ncbi:MAG: DnaA ATPase domain-containing protein, partial [Mangrovicoccus sp.]